MKRTYSKEFKIKACELVMKDNISVAVVAEKFGIHHVMLHRWVSEYRELGEEAFVGKGHKESEQATNNPKFATVSKWYKFYFYEDCFECFWKSGFIKKNRTVYYKDITDIECSVVTINFMPCYTYKFKIAGQKNLKLSANFRRQIERIWFLPLST